RSRHCSAPNTLSARQQGGESILAGSEKTTRGSPKENAREGADRPGHNGSAPALPLAPPRVLRGAVSGLVAVRVDGSTSQRLVAVRVDGSTSQRLVAARVQGSSGHRCLGAQGRATEIGSPVAEALCRGTDNGSLRAAGFCTAAHYGVRIGATVLCRATDNGSLGSKGLCCATDNRSLGASGLRAGASKSCRPGSEGLCCAANNSSCPGSEGLWRAADHCGLRAAGLCHGADHRRLAATILRGAADHGRLSAAGRHVTSRRLPAISIRRASRSLHATSGNTASGGSIAYRLRRRASPDDAGSSGIPTRGTGTSGASSIHAPSRNSSDATPRRPDHGARRGAGHGSRSRARVPGSERRADAVAHGSADTVARSSAGAGANASAFHGAVQLGVGEPVAVAGTRARPGRVGGVGSARRRRRVGGIGGHRGRGLVLSRAAF
ncbi:unnamed protein product, partial [Urochloa humidicola]